ncbi:MAG: hypothetical protein AAF768_10675 [Pseudomonadota bacterium]
MTGNREEIDRASSKLDQLIEQSFNEAKRFSNEGRQAHKDLAEKLLLASGTALGVLSTLFATEVSHIEPSDFLGPVVVLISSMLSAGIGLWSRAIVSFKRSSHSLWESQRLAYMKAQAEKHFLGSSNTSAPDEPPQPIKFPKGWLNVLDYSVAASGLGFILGVSWTAINLAI